MENEMTEFKFKVNQIVQVKGYDEPCLVEETYDQCPFRKVNEIRRLDGTLIQTPKQPWYFIKLLNSMNYLYAPEENVKSMAGNPIYHCESESSESESFKTDKLNESKDAYLRYESSEMRDINTMKKSYCVEIVTLKNCNKN